MEGFTGVRTQFTKPVSCLGLEIVSCLSKCSYFREFAFMGGDTKPHKYLPASVVIMCIKLVQELVTNFLFRIFSAQVLFGKVLYCFCQLTQRSHKVSFNMH